MFSFSSPIAYELFRVFQQNKWETHGEAVIFFCRKWIFGNHWIFTNGSRKVRRFSSTMLPVIEYVKSLGFQKMTILCSTGKLGPVWSLTHDSKLEVGDKDIRRFLQHSMMTSSNGNIFHVTGPLCGNSPVTGEFPVQRPVTRSFDIFFDLYMNKRLSKQSWGWWFETPSHPLWRHCNVVPPKLVLNS